MKVTREMIGAAHDVCIKKGDFILSADLLERIYLAMDALANHAEIYGSPFCYHDGRNIVDPQHKEDVDVFPLYREAAPRVPEGWKLVPIGATGKMIDATSMYLPLTTISQVEYVYSAMLDAAPEYKGDK